MVNIQFNTLPNNIQVTFSTGVLDWNTSEVGSHNYTNQNIEIRVNNSWETKKIMKKLRFNKWVTFWLNGLLVLTYPQASGRLGLAPWLSRVCTTLAIQETSYRIQLQVWPSWRWHKPESGNVKKKWTEVLRCNMEPFKPKTSGWTFKTEKKVRL